MRPFFNHAYEALRGEVAEGVEVGVARGENAQEVLRHWGNLTLSLVDNYCESPTNREEALIRLKGTRHKWVLASSYDAADQFIDGSLDLVYLDGDHTETGVRFDILRWAPKVRRGGFLGGHDYANTTVPGVRRAVNGWVTEMDLILQAIGEDWWVRL